MADRSMGRTAWNLFLALINATLILLAVCLFLAWRVLSAAEDVSANFAATSARIEPLTEDITALTEEIRGARSDLAELRTAAQTQAGTTDLAPVTERLDQIEGQLSELTDWSSELREDPDAIIQKAIDAAFVELRAVLAETVELIRSARTGS